MRDDRSNLTWLLASLILVLSLALGARHRDAVERWLPGQRQEHASGRALAPAADAPRAPTAEPLRVLFLGNSLTATNDIPGMVARLAAAAKQARRFVYKLDTPGAFGLSEHAVTGRVPAHLRQRWDTVVLQDQGQRPGWPSKLDETVTAPARVLDRAIRAAGAKTLFYVTYARREGDPDNVSDDTYDAMQNRIVDGYSKVARELNASLVPVGVIWQAVYHAHPTLRLWMQDGQHPSVAGSYLAACAFYAHFYRDSPVGNAYGAGLVAADARAIQEGVAQVMAGWHPTDATMPSEPASQPNAGASRDLPTSAASAGPAAAGIASPQYADAERDRARHAQIEGDRAARALRHARSGVPITLYSATWCGYCQRASAYMHEAGIAFDEYDIDRDSGAKAAAQRLNPRGSLPTIDLAGEVLIGWNPRDFQDALDRAVRARARL